jgi:hypothetical protein
MKSATKTGARDQYTRVSSEVTQVSEVLQTKGSDFLATKTMKISLTNDRVGIATVKPPISVTHEASRLEVKK